MTTIGGGGVVELPMGSVTGAGLDAVVGSADVVDSVIITGGTGGD